MSRAAWRQTKSKVSKFTPRVGGLLFNSVCPHRTNPPFFVCTYALYLPMVGVASMIDFPKFTPRVSGRFPIFCVATCNKRPRPIHVVYLINDGSDEVSLFLRYMRKFW